MKTCIVCGLQKLLTEFHTKASNKDNKDSRCRLCAKELKAKYYLANKAHILEKTKTYKKENEHSISSKKAQYYQQEKDRIRIYRKNKRKVDLNYKLARNLRRRLVLAVHRDWRAGSAVVDLGCTIEFFKTYIECLFQAGMSWKNYGEWHLDHIVPLAFFDLTNREQFLNACHYTNYQPLWAVDNLSKNCKLNWTKQ